MSISFDRVGFLIVVDFVVLATDFLTLALGLAFALGFGVGPEVVAWSSFVGLSFLTFADFFTTLRTTFRFMPVTGLVVDVAALLVVAGLFFGLGGTDSGPASSDDDDDDDESESLADEDDTTGDFFVTTLRFFATGAVRVILLSAGRFFAVAAGFALPFVWWSAGKSVF